MGIKPALGWLALLLFTTSAQAEGAREVLKHAPKIRTPSVAAPVTPKTKAPGPLVAVAAPSPSLVVLESTTKARGDYEAETYSGVPLDAPFAKERGLDKGLVTMVFEHQQRPAFRVGRDRIRRVLRLAADADRTLTLVRASTSPVAARPKDHLDVLDTEDGMIVVDTTTANAGMFTTSDVYAFARNAITLEQRIVALEAAPSPARDRIRQALVIAEWSH